MSGIRYPMAPPAYNVHYENLRNQWIARSLVEEKQVLRFARVVAFREGFHSLVSQNTTWASLVGAASATANEEPTGTGIRLALLADTTSNQWDDLTRAFFAFDLTGVLRTDSVVRSARFVVRSQGGTGGASWTSNFGGSVVLVAGPASASGRPVNADFNDYGSTNLAESSVTFVSGGTAQTIAYTLNAAGIAHLSRTAPSMFGLRVSHDVNNVEPTWASANKDEGYFYNHATLRTPAFLDLVYYY